MTFATEAAGIGSAEAQSTLEALRTGEHPGPANLSGALLIDADLSGLNLAGADLSGANLSRANLTGTNLLGARLRKTVLFDAVLDDAELTGAVATGANFEQARGQRVGFGGADLSEVSMLGAMLRDCSFTSSTLHGAVLQRADLQGSRFRQADLSGADLTAADLRNSDLCDASVSGAHLREADLRGARVSGVTGYESAEWLRADLRDINFAGAYLLRRFAMDQNYLHEFRTRSRLTRGLYWAWWLSSDCGRSLTRWAAVVVLQVLLFGWLYGFVDVSYGANETWLSPIYYSVVTITTLGYGDVLPASVGAQAVCMVEVVMGYLMLGGLLSIFSNKMARRAE